MIKNRNISDVGELKHRLDLYYPSGITQDDGGELKTETLYRSGVHCKAEKWKGLLNEITAQMIESHRRTKFTIRYDGNVIPDMKILFKGYWYQVIEIVEVGFEDDYIELNCIGVPPKVT